MANFKGITLPDGTTYFPEGGGGSADKEWKLIADVTTEEQVNKVEITQDTEGNPFELEQVHIVVNGKLTDDESIQQAHVVLNSTNFANMLTIPKNSTNLDSGNQISAFTLIGTSAIGGFANGAYGAIATSLKYSCKAFTDNKVTKISVGIASAAKKFEIGANIKVYGR